jgi:hypothetical protein
LNFSYNFCFTDSISKRFSFGGSLPIDYNEFQLCIKNKMIEDSIKSLKKEIANLSEKTRKKTKNQVAERLIKQDNLSSEVSEFEECIQLILKESLN